AIVGLSFDLTQSYTAIAPVLVIVLVISAILFLLFKPYRSSAPESPSFPILEERVRVRWLVSPSPHPDRHAGECVQRVVEPHHGVTRQLDALHAGQQRL